ncbi:unnamed protein product [Brachionus calyciflorus]|uniref:BRO1 domain-containing protein n=1 Tax=Brachionus calyciflorus TaxID=104777 RepID=A0A813YKC1_9BILA|nr:unnamed protein product [Brachionus calyciflorus]
MGGLVSSNNQMVIIPQKKTSKLDLIKPIKHHIKHLKKKPENFMNSIESFNTLRNDALNSSLKGKEKLDKMLRYYDQLTSIENKLPFNKHAINIEFTWENSINNGAAKISLNDGLFESLCVLFNIGAMASELAASQDLDSENGLKEAIKMYKLASSCFEFIQNNKSNLPLNDPKCDLNDNSLSFFKDLMFAHAQEVSFLKAKKENFSNLNISKIAIQCSTFFSNALDFLKQEPNEHLNKGLGGLVTAKRTFYKAIAEYYKSQDDYSQNKFGSSLGRLKICQELLMLKEIKEYDQKVVKSYNQMVNEEYERIDKENSRSFYMPIESKSSLEEIQGFDLASTNRSQIRFPLSDNFIDLFFNL